MDPNNKIRNPNGIELNLYNGDYFNVQDEDYISIEPNDDNNKSELDYNLLDSHDSESENFNFTYEGILKSPFKLPKRRNKHNKKRNKYINSQNEYDDLNELLIDDDDDDETYNNYSKVPTYQESDDETLDNDVDNLSNSDLFLLNQEEIPFVNLWSSFSKIFIKSVLRSTKRYNTYEKEIRKNYLISLLAVIATSIIYLILALYTYIMDGYSQRNIHDLDSYAERAMVFSSLFLIFTSCLGLIGVRYKFKPMIVLYILMNIISFSFQCYSVKQIHNVVIHVERNMAFAWWDIYTPDVIKNIESENKCCGYLDYTDYAVPLDNICPEEIVHKKVKFETLGPIPVTVKKNRFNKTFSIPDIGDMNNYFSKEEMRQIQVKIEEKPEKNKNTSTSNGTSRKGESKSNNNINDLKRRDIPIDSIPGGCYKYITSKVAGSLSMLCIFCWILSVSSPFALLFSLLFIKNLDIKKKSCEYF